MGLSNNKIKSKMIELVCEKFITKDSKGKIKFKSYLNDAIEQGDISHDDALSISLELMSSIKKYDFHERTVQNELENLVLRVTKFNLGENATIKNSVLFFNDYSYENEVLSEYIDGISPDDCVNVEVSKPQKNKPEDIKKYFNHLSRDDLCYILGKSPDLTFEKDKVLKKQIVNEFLKYDFDSNKLADASTEDIKKYLELLANKTNELTIKTRKQKRKYDENSVHKNIIYNDNREIISKKEKINTSVNSINFRKNSDKSIITLQIMLEKARKYNAMTFQNMFLLKSYYAKIYDEVTKNKFEYSYVDIKKFIYYYSHFDEIKDVIRFIELLRQYEDDINRFYIDYNQNDLFYSNKVDLINKYEDLYKVTSKINNYHVYLRNKIIDEFPKLNYFINGYMNFKNEYLNADNQITNVPFKEKEMIQFETSNVDLDTLINKIRLFTYKKLSSMVLLKSEYNEIYQEISRMDSNVFNGNGDIKRFKYYFEHFDLINECIELIDKIKQKETLLDNFNTKLEKDELGEISKVDLIQEFKELYVIVYPINKYDYCLKDKIIDEFHNLDYFIEYYENLLDCYDFKTDNYMQKIELIVKINSFNDKTLQEMVSLKNEYYDIYQEISRNINNRFYLSDVIIFIDNFECCEQAVDLINKIRQNNDLIDRFCVEIYSGEYLSNFKRYVLIVEFKEFYDFACQIYSFPEWFEYIIFNQFDTFERFMTYYGSLLTYNDYKNEKLWNLNNIRSINEKYIENEINKYEPFFNDIRDDNKKRAIVCDEDNIKVVAGAGAGKTFIIQKKIKYLIEKRKVDAEKILCLCYTGKGAHDLKEKINNDDVNIFTFHGFCREVSEKCGEYRATDDKLLDDVINNYIRNVIDDDNKLNDILEYFNYYVKNPSKHDFDSFEEYKEFKRGNKLKTLRNKYDFYNGYQKQSYNGEVVRSLEELVIANFLFMHNIDYIYEGTYEHEFLTPIIHGFFASYNYFCLNRDFYNDLDNLIKFNEFEENLKKYRPDFYLPDKKIYLEHFGVARDNIAHWLQGDAQKKYTDEMNSKLEVHKLYNTKLITTFSYNMTEGTLLDDLRESLSDYYKLVERDKKEIFKIIINNNRSEDFKHFKMLLKSFINIFEAKKLDKSKLDDYKNENRSQKNSYLKRKHELFLNIISEIYEDYDLWNAKGGLYYNREVTNALNLIENGEFKECYDYIFIDEYQDINYIRCKLLQELQKINNSKLLVVGDDWQSIYGFNGSEVSLFVDFNEYFPNSETIKISENRRNCQALIDISSSFICQNENQEKKDLEYYKKDKPTNSNPIKLVPYDKKENKILFVEKVVREIIKSTPKKDLEILLLGRNNKDINFLINNRLFKQVYGDKKYKIIEYSKNPNITIYFMSIHQSKGLEKDGVIILNFENYDYGFPNQIDDDSVLHFIKEKEDYLFAEERRLLYVALTRTRNNVYLIYPNINYSDFIKELKNDYGLDDSEYKIKPKDLIELYEFNHFYCGNDYKYWYPNSIPIPIEDIDYYFKIKDEGFLNAIELELFIWYENLLNYDDPLENAFKKLIGFDEGTKSNLRNKSLKMRNNILNTNIWLLVNDKKCNFTISGIGPKSVRFSKRIIFDNENIKKEYTGDILRRYNVSIEDLERLLDI